jgi:hypothetical protein
MDSEPTPLNKKFCDIAAQNPARAVARLGAFYEQQNGMDGEAPLFADINAAALQGSTQLLQHGDYYHAYELATIVDQHLHRNLCRHEQVLPELLRQYEIAQHLRADALRGYVESGDKSAQDIADQIIVDTMNDPDLMGTQLLSLFLQVAVELNKRKRKAETVCHPQYRANEQDIAEHEMAGRILRTQPNLSFDALLQHVTV